LCRTKDGWVLAIAVHHMVWDGRSAEVLVTELAASYDDAERPESSPIGYAPERQAEPESSPNHWVDALAGAPRDVWPDPLPPSRALGVVEHEIADEDVTALRALAATLGATPFMLGLACFSLALRRWHANDEVVVCAPVSVRPAAAEHLIGLHVNMLPLRLVTTPQLTGRKFVDAVRRTWVEAWQHRDVAFQRIVEATVHGRRRSVDAPYSQVMFLHNRFPHPIVTADGVRWSAAHLPSREPKCDLLVAWSETTEGWTVRVEHALARLDTTVAEQLVGDVLAVLKALVNDPDTELGAMPGCAVRPALDDRIAGMWCAALAVDAVNRDANFFELGGNSMAAMRVVTALRATFGVRVPVRLIFDTDTFVDFVQRLRQDHLGSMMEG
jgi:acyl carrier protein